jgi:parvulin-like peptidyl-prolyl isomerase
MNTPFQGGLMGYRKIYTRAADGHAATGNLRGKGTRVQHALFYILMAAVLFSLTAAAQAALPEPSGTVATINGVAVTEADVDDMTEQIIPTVLYHREITAEKKDRFRKDAIEKLIDIELLYQEAVMLDIEVPETEVRKAFDNQRAGFRSESEFEAALRRKGLTEETFRKKLQKSILVNRLIAAKVGEPAKATDTEAHDYYEANKGKFVDPEKIKFNEVFIHLPPDADDEAAAVKTETAKEVLDRAKAGEDFCELALRYSEDQLKSRCGDAGAVHRGRIDETLEKALVGMKSGDVAIVPMETGIIIVKFGERMPERLLSFDEVKDRIKKELSAAKWSKLHEEYLQQLRAKAKIERRS